MKENDRFELHLPRGRLNRRTRNRHFLGRTIMVLLVITYFQSSDRIEKAKTLFGSCHYTTSQTTPGLFYKTGVFFPLA